MKNAAWEGHDSQEALDRESSYVETCQVCGRYYYGLK